VVAEAEARGLRIVFLGPPNSGKGTQAALLAEALGVPAISTGEMLRAAVAAGSALGARVKDVMARGELVSDELMAEVVRQRLSQDDVAGGCILDGYPRTVAQARTLEEILGPRGIDHVILVEAPEEVLIARALGRGREDDREEVVRERLRVYRDKTAPLEAYYEDRGLLRRIDGARSIDEVQAAIESVLGVRRVG